MMGRLVSRAVQFAAKRVVAQAAGGVLERLPVRFSLERGVMLLAPDLVERGALRAAQRLSAADSGPEAGLSREVGLRITQCDMIPHDDHFAFRLTLENGKTVEIRIIPEKIHIHGETATVHMRIFGGRRRGLTVAPDQRALAFAAHLFDTLFGVIEKRLNRIPGLTLEGDRLTYARDLSRIKFLAPLRKRLGPDAETTIPLSIQESWLEIHFGGHLAAIAQSPLKLSAWVQETIKGGLGGQDRPPKG